MRSTSSYTNETQYIGQLVKQSKPQWFCRLLFSSRMWGAPPLTETKFFKAGRGSLLKLVLPTLTSYK